VTPFLHPGIPLVGLVLGAISLIFGLLYLLIVVRFKALLLSYSGFIKGVIIANMAVSILSSFLIGRLAPLGYLYLGIGVLILVYLVRSVTRLAAEGDSDDAEPTPDPTSPSVTPPASTGGAPSVGADHKDVRHNQMSIPDELKKLSDLRKEGSLTEQEFSDAKARLLASDASGKKSKAAGWLLIIFGLVLALPLLLAPSAHRTVSETIGRLTIPIIIIVVGCYYAGFIKKAI
jgi:hypothetical protein